MDVKELSDLLVTSSEKYGEYKFIPWWEENYEDCFYQYDMFKAETIQDAEECLETCLKEDLLSPIGRGGYTLFHLLVWHNFYNCVEKMFLSGKITDSDVDIADANGHGLTPFLLACVQGNLAMAKLLLDHGANSSLCDDRGMNAYHLLAYPRLTDDIPQISFSYLERSVKQRGIIARLINCDINQKNNTGLTALEQLLSTDYCSSYTWPLAEVFLDKGAATGYMDEDGNTLLMMARRNGHNTAALQLIQRCPEMINTANKNGITPLQHAVEYGNQAMYLALKDHGAEPSAQMELFPLRQITSNLFAHIGNDNMDGLSIALYMTDKMIRQIDPDDDDEIGEVRDILHNALISDKDAHVLDACKDGGIDLTMPLHYSGQIFCLRDECLKSCYGMSTIHKLQELGVDMNTAVVRGRTPANVLASTNRGDKQFYEEVTKLFSKESMEKLDNNGVSAVHLAAKNGHVEMLKVMLEKQVNINLTEDEPGEAGATPLHLACSHSQVDVVKLLIAAGADDTLKNSQGETPAHFVLLQNKWGAKLNQEQKAELLKELKHLDIPREDGQTPLMLLTFWDEDLLPIFLDKGVNVNHTDNDGRTALMLITDKDIIKGLLQAGAEINVADNSGNTALHYALESCSVETARYLIRKGADYNRPNNEGKTPAQIAAERGFETVLDLMTDIK